jgi:hypothetical protein
VTRGGSELESAGTAADVPEDPDFDFDDDEDDLPLPDLPPLPADPRWRLEHLPFLMTVSFALVLCVASVGFFTAGPPAALGAALGVLIVTISYSMSTLVIAWADTVRPELVLPVAILTYVLKYTILGVILAYGVATDWPGRTALGMGIVVGVMVWTGVQAWWLYGRTVGK